MSDPAPSVTITIPVLNEEAHLASCLAAVTAQTYPRIVEVLVVDGGSHDRTREIARSAPGVTLLDNPRRIQAAALNVGIGVAAGEVFVRVDGHTLIEPDYVARCVDALVETGASYVGGAMSPIGDAGRERGIALAMRSRLGAGPARFHSGGRAGWVDTAYLGAFWVHHARLVGGYDEDKPTNEDAELAQRLRPHGGVWFDPAIRSRYVPRGDLSSLARQFFSYGRGRADTVRKHPQSLAARQLAPPILVLGLFSPWRRAVATAYLTLVVGRALVEARDDRSAALIFSACLPTMHLAWGVGFLTGLVSERVRHADGVLGRAISAPTGPGTSISPAS